MENFKGVILSSWNSVYGPKIEYVWLLKDHALFSLPKEKCTKIKHFDVIKDRYSFLNVDYQLSEETNVNKNSDHSFLIESVTCCLEQFKDYSRMSGKLLLTEMESKNPFMEKSSRVYHLQDKILFSIVFYDRPVEVSKDSENLCLSISVMFSCETFSTTFKFQNVIDLHLRKVATVVSKLWMDRQQMATEASKLLEDLCKAVNILSENKSPLDLVQCFPRFSQFQLRAKFLARSIVSHMETSGYSVVIGSSKFTVNQITQILLLFNNKKEKQRSALKSQSKVYHRGLYVQSLIRNYSENQGLSLLNDCINDGPITIIDTDSYKVRQSLDTLLSENNSNSLTTVRNSGKLIPQFLNDLFLFEEHKWATNDIFKSLLKYIYIQAVALIKIVEIYRKEGSTATEKQTMTLMNVSDVVDFKIYLGYAEKLKPGIKTSVMKV